MDDRKKQINELEQRKREQIVSLDALLIRLGEEIIVRADNFSRNDDSDFEELDLFRRLKNDIADSEAAIQAVEDQIRRFRELEESIEAKEQEESAGSKELVVLYGRLGKQLLDAASDNAQNNGDYADFCAPYRDQAEALLTKAISLEERLAGLEGKESGNVFTWVGKGAQSLVLRSFFTKAQDNLEQLRRNVGERYSRRGNIRLIDGETDNDNASPQAMDINNVCVEIERRWAEDRILLQDLSDLKEERRNVSGSMNVDGGPLKHIQTLKKHISNVRDELKTLYRRIGAEAGSVGDAGRRHNIVSLIVSEDQEVLDNAARIDHLIHEDEREIEKLQASLAIDDEKAKIDKYRRMIQDKRDKIAQAEKNITEFEESIRVSEASIEKLQKIL